MTTTETTNPVMGQELLKQEYQEIIDAIKQSLETQKKARHEAEELLWNVATPLRAVLAAQKELGELVVTLRQIGGQLGYGKMQVDADLPNLRMPVFLSPSPDGKNGVLQDFHYLTSFRVAMAGIAERWYAHHSIDPLAGKARAFPLTVNSAIEKQTAAALKKPVEAKHQSRTQASMNVSLSRPWNNRKDGQPWADIRAVTYQIEVDSGVAGKAGQERFKPRHIHMDTEVQDALIANLQMRDDFGVTEEDGLMNFTAITGLEVKGLLPNQDPNDVSIVASNGNIYTMLHVLGERPRVQQSEPPDESEDIGPVDEDEDLSDEALIGRDDYADPGAGLTATEELSYEAPDEGETEAIEPQKPKNRGGRPRKNPQ